MKRDAPSNGVLTGRIGTIWLDPAFSSARTTTYVVILAMLFFMMFAPVHYVCASTSQHCFGCGFRTAVRLFMQGDIAGSIASNQLIVPAVIFVCFSILDLLTLYKTGRFRRDVPKSSSR